MQAIQMKKQRGLSMLELLIVFVIVFAVIGFAFVLYNRNDTSSKSLATQQQMMAVASAVREISMGSTYAGISSATLVSTKKVPSDMISGTTLINKFNGAVTIAAATYPTGATANNAFTLALPQLPTAVCVDVVNKALQQFPRIVVGATTVHDKLNATPVVATVATIASGCAATDPVTVTLTAS